MVLMEIHFFHTLVLNPPHFMLKKMGLTTRINILPRYRAHNFGVGIDGPITVGGGRWAHNCGVAIGMVCYVKCAANEIIIFPNLGE